MVTSTVHPDRSPLESPVCQQGIPTPYLQVAIVNYRTAELVVNCLRSLQSELAALPSAQVVVVDNASGDGSAEQLEAAVVAHGWQSWVKVVASPHNGGFAYGNNLAVGPALAQDTPPDYFMLLNPDTVVQPGAIHTLLEFMQQHPQVGLAGSSFEDEDGTPWHHAFRFPSVISELEGGARWGVITKLLSPWLVVRDMGDQPEPVDWLSGACLMVRRQVFEAVGLMDDEYFLYCEEMDFCLQAQRAGWPCWYVPSSRIMHCRGKSTGMSDNQSVGLKPMPQYWFHSRRRYFVKNYGLAYAALADAAWLGTFSLYRLRQRLQRKPDTDPPGFLADFARNSIFRKGGAIAKEQGIVPRD
jgi:N-acetylglucosaminyl-diphospho-decaprenol L-rhamnosyltransferase